MGKARFEKVPSDAALARMRAGVFKEISIRTRTVGRRKRIVFAGILTVSLGMVGSATAVASVSHETDVSQAAIDATNQKALDAAGVSTLEELEGVGLVADPSRVLPVGADEQMISQLTDDELRGLAQGQTLEPTFTDLSKLDGFVAGGFAENSPDLEFHWYGPIPEKARKIAAAAARRGVTTHFIKEPYSSDQMDDAVTNLIDALNDRGIDVRRVEYSYRSIAINGPGLDTPTSIENIRHIARETIGDIPVTVIPWTGPNDGMVIPF